eukprot:11380768-Alexandrium_andersonii.AAC.1
MPVVRGVAGGALLQVVVEVRGSTQRLGGQGGQSTQLGKPRGARAVVLPPRRAGRNIQPCSHQFASVVARRGPRRT